MANSGGPVESGAWARHQIYPTGGQRHRYEVGESAAARAGCEAAP